MNIERRGAGTSLLQRRAEEAGFVACAGGRPRDRNPYFNAAPVDAQSAGLQRLLADAWWRGWDRAHRDGQRKTDPTDERAR